MMFLAKLRRFWPRRRASFLLLPWLAASGVFGIDCACADAPKPGLLAPDADDSSNVNSRQGPPQKPDAGLTKRRNSRLAVEGYQTRTVEGWLVLVSDELLSSQKEATDTALSLLRDQLKTVADVLPPKALAQLRDVPIWMSPAYEGARPTAEYHPGSDWLRKAGRRPELVRCVELSNIAIFEQEVRRMPMMILHELAHAYHDQVLGFDHPLVKAAYERAVASRSYESVPRANRRNERAYAMTDHKEYFAESSEAFFGTNDFYPFDRAQLKTHDPQMFNVLVRVWHVAGESTISTTSTDASDYRVTAPPASMKLDRFYTKYVDAHGYPVVSSSRVNDYALKEAAYLVDMMLAERPDVRKAMVKGGSRMIVMAHDEFTTDIPEHSGLQPKDYWDARARGLGGSRNQPVCSCAEENVLAFEGDPYSTENILIHEFAHNIHLRGMVNVDPTFDERLKQAYDRAIAQGLWKGKYASTNHAEYFAEGVQSWFDNNRAPDHDHNYVDTRAELKEYDPGLAAMCEEVFGATKLVYTKPTTRLVGHLEGYDPSKAPVFQWPERLQEARIRIKEQAAQRGENRKQKYTN